MMGETVMRRLRIDVPLWLARRRRSHDARWPALRRDVRVEVAIVGGGITGAAVAYRFAEAGISVAVVDGQRIARGSTAASTALLMQEPDQDLEALSRRYGRTRAQRTWQLSRTATRDMIATLKRLGVACNLERRDSVYYAMTARDAKRLRAEHRLRATAGVRGAWLDGARLRQAIGFDAMAAIRTRGNAQVDPVKACLGLMRAATARGALLFERSPVNTITRTKEGVVVSTPRGAVHANRVVIATGFATPEFKPLHGRFRMLTTYVVATRPLTAAERRAVGLDAVMLWDMGRPYHYARWTPDRRLLLGGGDRPLGPERLRVQALREGTSRVHAFFQERYPSLADVPLEYGWEGLFATTPDGLPYIGPHRRYPRHLFALGYGGNGMTFGFLAARLLLERYRGDHSPDHELFSFSR
jgi:glycine/D-amino acid oxidase-like deaminating enzyme